MDPDLAVRCRRAGRFEVRVVPKAACDRIDIRPTDDGSATIVVRVTAAPEDGKANKAVLALLADALGVPKSALHVLKGAKGKTKTIGIRGA